VRDTLASRCRMLFADRMEDVLQHLRSGAVDLLLLDLTLAGGVDGREVLRRMGPKRCPILIFTGRDERDLYGTAWDDLRRLGADDLLIKGMNVEESLILKVDALLGRPS
jgi:DNA-binding response OmpR family regulator